MLEILTNPTVTLTLIGIALVCVVHEWSESRARERLCAGCATCVQRAREAKDSETRERLARIVHAGRCPQCFSMLAPRSPGGTRFCTVCERPWPDLQR